MDTSESQDPTLPQHPEPVAVVARREALAALGASGRDPFDVLVIGGGITGAGVAREAALAGLRVALVERDDFASGTSSRSSRLVHGGVRYLEHGHLGLVFEASHERRVLLGIAPHLVRPLAFTWPVYRGARVPRWKVRAGLTLYDVLSLFRNVGRHESLSAAETLDREPALAPDGLLGGARYWDAATDDARLTLASAIAARESGATVVNHAEIVGAIRSAGGALEGAIVRDTLTGEAYELRARVTVNATGPWSDATARLVGDVDGSRGDAPSVLGSAGAHIAVPRHRLGNNDAVTIVSPLDGRVMFVLPAGAHAIIGTTERPARTGPDEIRATAQEIDYLLRTVNVVFPFANLTRDDVIAAWSGIRPLAVARSRSGSANSASREHAIAHDRDGLISVTGGKLTTYRSMAAELLTHVRGALATQVTRTGGASLRLDGAPISADPSEHTPLPGGDIVSLESAMHDASSVTSDHAVAERLTTAYGSRWRNVWSYAQRDATLAHRIVDGLPYVFAEVSHAVEREMACTLADVLVRRTHIAFETRDHGKRVARAIVPLVAELLGWREAEQERQLLAYDAETRRLFGIDE